MITPFQICYGIIYGMGAKSLGEQMGIKENDAACYIDSFKSRYTGKALSVNYLLGTVLLNYLSILLLIFLKRHVTYFSINIAINQMFSSTIAN